MKRLAVIVLFLSRILSGYCQEDLEKELIKVLGDFPKPPILKIDTLEITELQNGKRLKIEFLSEPGNNLFDRPEDKIRAYLFVPKLIKDEKRPAVIAIHQDGSNTHIGKKEPAGIDGDSTLYYGLELFNRGYVVICPDRFQHAERRMIPNADIESTNDMRDLAIWMRWCGELSMQGRTNYGKEIYDLMRTVDVLQSYSFVDSTKIGAIGHSAGGNILVYFMFADKRIKAAVSSCGFFTLEKKYNISERGFPNPVFALPGLLRIGNSMDYLKLINPRPILLTCGKNQSSDLIANENQVASFEETIQYAKESGYNTIEPIIFNGSHEFPYNIRVQTYNWLDKKLENHLNRKY